jgi:hypothetical protein
MISNRMVKGSIGVAVAFAAVVLGAVAVQALVGNPAADNPKPEAPTYEIRTNERGQTYGSGDQPTTERVPDLIETLGDDGKTTGYVLRSDLEGKQPRNPAEAVALQAEQQGRRVVPLYKADGVTVIGSFTVNAGVVTTSTVPKG